MSTPHARTRKSPGERSAQIRAAASALARDAGLTALTLRAVAQRAGVASGLVAHYTASMDELVAAAFVDLVGGELDDVRALVEAAGDPASRLATLFRTVLDGDRDDITLVWVDAWSRSRDNPVLSTAIDEQMARWQALIAGIVRDGCRGDAFATDDADAVAWQLLAMMDGLSAHALARGADPAVFARRLAQAAETLIGARPGALVAALAD